MPDDPLFIKLAPSGVLEEIFELIGSRYEPQDVFAEEALERWAEQHGYFRPE